MDLALNLDIMLRLQVGPMQGNNLRAISKFSVTN